MIRASTLPSLSSFFLVFGVVLFCTAATVPAQEEPLPKDRAGALEFAIKWNSIFVGARVAGADEPTPELPAIPTYSSSMLTETHHDGVLEHNSEGSMMVGDLAGVGRTGSYTGQSAAVNDCAEAARHYFFDFVPVCNWFKITEDAPEECEANDQLRRGATQKGTELVLWGYVDCGDGRDCLILGLPFIEQSLELHVLTVDELHPVLYFKLWSFAGKWRHLDTTFPGWTTELSEVDHRALDVPLESCREAFPIVRSCNPHDCSHEAVHLSEDGLVLGSVRYVGQRRGRKQARFEYDDAEQLASWQAVRKGSLLSWSADAPEECSEQPWASEDEFLPVVDIPAGLEFAGVGECEFDYGLCAKYQSPDGDAEIIYEGYSPVRYRGWKLSDLASDETWVSVEAESPSSEEFDFVPDACAALLAGSAAAAAAVVGDIAAII